MNCQRNKIMAVVLVGCVVMGLIDVVVRPGYLVKSILKLLLFLLLPWVVCYRRDPGRLGALFARGRTRTHPLLIGLLVYGGVLLLYFTIGRFFDFSAVVGSLDSDLGVSRKNFLFVSLYISLVNSLLEEFFFRGFGFLTLLEHTSRRTAYLFSALSFALYHVAMMAGWFQPDLMVLLILLLALSGLALDFINEHSRTLYASWCIHMFANFAINTVGFLLFGLL